MSQREDALKFETGRIKALQEERLHIQKKTFTKWMNSFLVKARMEVEDLFTDLADGRKLLKLLEIISGEKLGKPNNGRMRVHKIENVNKSLAFLHTKVRLESIGAEDIVDGNPRLILGLIWTIILRFQIQEIEIDVDEENESSEKKSAKDALLLWCQRKTNGYQNVNIQDFTGSWRSGLGFNALIHAHRPDLLDFNALVPTRHIDNLNNAFDVAERSLGIPRLLDAEDIDTSKPDEKSVLTYVASYYHTFAQMYNKDKSGRRIANIISQIKEADDLKYKYEVDGKSLLAWIRTTIVELNSREFPNNLEGVQKLLVKFKEHITVTKPPKYNEKSEIEANYFIINTRLKELNQHLYVPPEGLLVHDIERAWEQLEKAEYQRELALREEVIRQTNLEQLAIRFEKKSLLREGYLKDMIQVLSDPRYGINLTQVEATLKKHEAISADILAREQRCEQLVTMADYLVKEQYHDCDRVRARANEITSTWDQLIRLLDNHKVNLERFSNLMQLVRDVDTILASIHELEEQLVSEDVGVHLIGVEDLLQNHSLVESQISSMGDTIKRIGKTAAGFTGKELSMVEGKIQAMNTEYDKVLRVCKERRCKLEDSRAYFLFVQDCEEEEAWVNEKLIVCSGPLNSCKDLRGVVSLIGSHKVLLDEIKARRGKIINMVERGNELVRVWENEGGNKELECTDVRDRIGTLEGKWAELRETAEGRSHRLSVVLEAFQFYSDANEMDSWVTEKRPLVSSSDYGSDEPSAQALLQRHLNLEEEIIAYEADVKGLNSQADKLVQAGINSIVELSETNTSVANGVEPHQNGMVEEYVTEQKLVPQEYWEDEVVEKTDYKTVTEERAVPQVKALYAFEGQEIQIRKGEVMFLLNKTNSDWWNVRKANGEDGFVPANYVKEIEPKVVMVQVRKPEVVKETKRVKKTRMVLQTVQKPKKPASPIKKSVSTASLQQQTFPPLTSSATEPILTRTERINSDYSSVLKQSAVRKQNLQESIKLFQFLRECDDFEKWIGEKKKYLSSPETNVQAAKRAFEKFLTDLTASSSRITEIDELVKQFDNGKSNKATLDKVNARADKIKALYSELLRLKVSKEKTLEGALSVELFNRTCEEVVDWMDEKMMQIDTDEWSNNDLKTVQALQRKHNNLERELAPINEKVQRVNLLAESVKRSYPLEEQNVDEKKRGVVQKWDTLVTKANERKHALEHAVGFQIFDQGVKNLMSWVSDCKAKMAAYVRARDVSSAEEALKIHSDLGDEIKAKDGEFDELVHLGTKIQHVGNEVGEKVTLLKREHGAVAEEYAEKSDWLHQVLDLQVFLREADHIDSCTRNHLQFVQSQDVGSNLDEVESLIKRHGDFENTLVAQDERLKVFDSMGGKLIEAGHFEEHLIKQRRANVISKKAEVKDLAKKRKSELHRSLKYHEFNNDVDETLSWVDEKIEVAKDESYKDLTNVSKKLKKHEAFAGELRANEVRIKNINRAGEKLVEVVPEKTPEIKASVGKLNNLWENLVVLSSEKYDKLRQAEAQASFNKNLDSVMDRLNGIQSNLKTGAKYGDRRSCKDAVKRANSLSTELGAVDAKIRELEALADEMQRENHFDSGKISERVREARDRMDQLVGPVERLKGELGNAYEYYSFLHELDAEGSWIREKMALVEQEYVIQDLHQAQTSVKKHKKLEQEVNNREPVVLKLVEKGTEFKGDQLHTRIDEFVALWNNLKEACSKKSRNLELSLKSQQFFFDSGEIETWMTEKELALTTKDFGKDIHSARVLLTKHKGIELEMDSYDGLVTEMKCMANQMVAAGHPDKVLISAKINGVDEHMGLLRRMANERREKLIRRVGVLEYFAEVDEFTVYVDEVFGREVGSNEYGVDYEHLQVLKGRFREVELKVDAVNETFRGLEAMAQRLAHDDSADDEPGARSVSHTAELVREKWNNMLGLMAAREQKLHAAGEIHAFNRDVADSLARINEKLNSIPDTVGRDVNSCEGMLRQHEAFENDLLALEAQLQVLVDDAARLQSLYPSNAANIRQEQSLVIDSWGNLQSRATLRKEQLQNAVDFWRFSAEYANLTSFINSLLTTLPSQPKVRDTASSQGLMTEHERIRSEIDAREDQFDRVFSLGHAMVEEDHPESAEVSRMVGNLRNLKDKLLVAWEHKKVYLDQLIDLNIFLRDAKQLQVLCTTQEVTIGNLELGDDVESVDKNLKKHEAFEKIVQTQEDKFSNLEVQGMKLVRQNHFESGTVQEKLVEVKAARGKVLQLCQSKRLALEERSKYVRFLRDVNETHAWVDEKIKKLQLDESVNKELNLSEKIKKLKKHQAFSAEVSSNKDRVEGLFKVGKEVGADQPELVQLRDRWGVLVKLVHEFGKGLEEAQDILEFTNQCELTDAWVREKESLVNAGDVGEDYEHCCEIIKKVDDFDSGIKVDDERIKNLNSLAQRLIKGGGDHGGVVSSVIQGLNERWGNLKVGLEAYRKKLERALDVHKFNRDAEEVQERIKSVRGLISLDVGRDLEHCETLVRKHEGVEVQVNAVGERVKELEIERTNLIETTGVDQAKLRRIDTVWMEISEVCLERHQSLSSSMQYHKFLKKFTDLKRYIETTLTKVQNTNLGGNVEEAEESVKQHKDLIDNVQAREPLYKDLTRIGRRHVTEKHEYSKEFSERTSELDELWGKLTESLHHMSGKLDQSLKMQRLFARISEVEVEIECNDAFLNARELGESLGAVLVLLRRHEEFTNAFGGIEAKVTELIHQGDSLAPGHFDAPAIKARTSELNLRLEKLKSKAQSRSLVLHESYELHKFVLEIHEIETYALEKLKIALDDNYSDMVNLQSKIQRHAAFESEVQANYERVTALISKSERLLRLDDQTGPLHSFMVEIQRKLDGIQSVWKELQTASTLKRERLQESYQALLFNQNLEDIEAWMDELEQQLESEDHGVDLESVQTLINKWMHLESEFLHKREVIAGIAKTADAFAKTNHYMADDINHRVDVIKDRYESLSEPLHIRRDNLEETNKFFEFLRDVGEEREWVDEKVAGVGVDAELGGNLTQVQSLQKKHNQLESEMISHEPLVGLLVNRSSAMVRSGHFASDQIQATTKALQDKFQELKDCAAVRRLRLADSMLSQTFYDEANELLSWMNEKANYVRNIECKDCENVSGLLKRLDAFQRDLAGFKGRIDKVVGTGEELVARGHFDGEKIQAKNKEVGFEYSELQKMGDKKRLRVSDAMKFYEFNKVCNECVDWINEMMNIAGSEDYGRDVEHVEVLIQKFEGFYSNVQESRVQAVLEMADGLIEEGYPDVDRVRGRAAEVKGMWEEFKELASARLEALLGAKQVHAFDRTADETISWINEKHSVVCSEEYGHDLESIQSLIRRHDAFENDLKPVETKVNEVSAEASRLRNLFVDASEHINVKHHACEEAWKELVDRTRVRGDKLNQAENLQAYFDDYTNLMAFVNELVAKVTSGELGRSVRAAEASLGKNEAYLKEIDAFKGVDEFCRRGEELVRNGHFMQGEINDKIKSLRGRWEYLKSVARERNDLFKKNLDLRLFLVQVDEFDKWMVGKEPDLKEYALGESIREVEELIREHEEFIHTLEAQEGRAEGLRRRTLIEEAWEEMRKREQSERENEIRRNEKQRIEGLKRREVERIQGEIIKTKQREDQSQQQQQQPPTGDTHKEHVRGGFLGGSRFGSLVFGGGRRGSEPAPTTGTELCSGEHLNNNSNRSSPFKLATSLTPPTSLEYIACSQQQQQSQGGSDQPSLLSRSESLRLLNTSSTLEPDTSTLKKPKRTPSFTTRRRTASFRRKKNPENLPPVEIEGYLERKHELQAGGKRAAVRSWKHYYVLLCGQLLCFFKDQEDFELSKVGSSSPISVYKCVCAAAVDYTKRKFVFRVKPLDGSEFLFAAESAEALDNWVRKINFHAQLEPKDQLLAEAHLGDTSSKEQSRVLMPPPPPPPKNQMHYDSTSTDEDDERPHHHRSKPKSRSSSSLQQPRSREPIYAEAPLDTPPTQVRTTASKPPIPPRSSSIVLNEQQQQNGARSPVKNNGSSVDVVDNQQYFVTPTQQRPVSVDRIVQQYTAAIRQQQHVVPPAPLPRSINTFKPVSSHSLNNNKSFQQQQQQMYSGPQIVYRNEYYGANSSNSSINNSSTGSLLYTRGPVSPVQQQLSPRTSGSLPPGMSLSSTSPNTSFHHHDQNSSSENEQGSGSVHSSSPSPHAAEHDPKKKKEGSGLMGLFRRKKATQL